MTAAENVPIQVFVTMQEYTELAKRGQAAKPPQRPDEQARIEWRTVRPEPVPPKKEEPVTEAASSLDPVTAEEDGG